MSNSYCRQCKGLIGLDFNGLVTNPAEKTKPVSVESCLNGLCLDCFNKKDVVK